jgi:hypothetical protein
LAVNLGAGFTDLALAFAFFAIGFTTLETAFFAGALDDLLTFFTGTFVGFFAATFTAFLTAATGFAFLIAAFAFVIGFTNFLGAALVTGFFMGIFAIDQSNKLVITYLSHMS